MNKFDAKEIALTKELQEQLFAAQAARAAAQTGKRLKRRSRTKFVMLPYGPTMQAAGKMNDATLAVMVELAYLVFKTRNSEVVLNNAVLSGVGISRWAKQRALRKLKTAGLVMVTWRGQRNPLVRVLW